MSITCGDGSRHIGDNADAIRAMLACGKCGDESVHDVSDCDDYDDYAWRCSKCCAANCVTVRVELRWFVSDHTAHTLAEEDVES